MSVEAIAIVLHHSRATGTAKLVLIGIANHDGDGGAWPTKETLAKYAGVSPDGDNVRKAVKRLRALGEVRVHVQAGGTRDCPDEIRPNRYDILVTCPPWCDRSREHRDTRKRGTGARQTTLPIALSTPVDEPVSDRGSDSMGGSDPMGGGGSVPIPKPYIEPDVASVVPKPKDARPCRECGLPEADCRRRPGGHDYEPRTVTT